MLAQIVEYVLALTASLIFSLLSITVLNSFISHASSAQLKADLSAYLGGIYNAANHGYWSVKAGRAGEVLSCSNNTFYLAYSNEKLNATIPFICSFNFKINGDGRVIFYFESKELKAVFR